MKKIRGFKVKLRKREILKALKYDSRYVSIGSDCENLIQEQIETAYSVIFPSVVYETYSISSETYEFIKNDILLGSAKLKGLFKKAAAFTIMAVTIGYELEKIVDSIKDQDLTKALILDAVGSEAAEQSANFISRILKDEAVKQECVLSVRFSPGYGDWPLDASAKILHYLDNEKIDLNLSPSGILNPRKSITAIQTWIQS